MARITDFMLFQQPEQAIVYVDVVTDATGIPKAIAENYLRLENYIRKLGVLMSDVPFVAYRNYESIDENNISMQIGFPIQKIVPENGDLKSELLLSSKVIICMYKGNYQEILSVYEEAAQWMQENGYQNAGICYEYYYNDNKYVEEDLLTKVVIPLR